MLLVPLVLSAFLHLWNPAGFPDFFYDEGVYMRRALNVVQGLGPQEGTYYDHPYFGQLFLAGILQVSGYPALLGTDAPMEALYMAPRLLMGALAVFDTLMVFKIAEKRYNNKVALIAALIFAVMPMTWLLRRILLDSLLLPFLLSSILVALHAKDSKHPALLALASGALLGLAIFTKVPVFTMLPLVGFVIASPAKGLDRRLKMLALFLAPAVLLPMIWPLYSVSVGEFDRWTHYVLWQTQRQSGGISAIVQDFVRIDPVLLVIGAAGIAYSIWRRNVFVVLWAVPFALFLALIGYVQYFHWISLLPVFSIAAARLLSDAFARLGGRAGKAIPFSIVGAIVAFGTVSTALLVATNMTSAQSAALAHASDYLAKNGNGHEITTLSPPAYSWILRDVYGHENVADDHRTALFRPIRTDSVLLVVDSHFVIDADRGPKLQELLDRSRAVATFEGQISSYDASKYPFGSMIFNGEGRKIEIRD